MSEQTVAGIVLIATPLLFNAGFTLLAQRFDYPDILRRPTHEVLERFRAGGTVLILTWWMFALSAVLFSALAVLLAIAVDDADPTVVVLGLVFGVLALAGPVPWPDPVAVSGPLPRPSLRGDRTALAPWGGDRHRLSGLQPISRRRRR